MNLASIKAGVLMHMRKVSRQAMVAAATGAIMGVSITAFAQPTTYCWIDAATGSPVQLGPPGWSPTGFGGIPGENPDPNHVAHGGHTFVKQPDGTWIDAATGNPVQLGPPGWSPTGFGGIPGENPDPNHVAHGGHTFVRVPCPPPVQPGQAMGPPAIPILPGIGFGFGIGGGHRGDDRR